MKKGLILALFASLGMLAQAQSSTQVNPNTNVAWPRVTGNGAPTIPCSAPSYGKPYLDLASNTKYMCGSSGWVQEVIPAGGYAGVHSDGNSGIVVGGQMQASTVAAGALHPASIPYYDVMAPIYGAACDGNHDDTAQIAAAATACSAGGGTIYIPATGAACTTSAPVVIPVNCDLELEGTLAATETMTEVVGAGITAETYNHRIFGHGTIDSRGLAARHVALGNFSQFEVTGIQLLNPASIAVIDAGTLSGGLHYQADVHDLQTYVPSGINSIPGSVGIWLDNASDSSIHSVTVIGSDIGVRDSVGGQHLLQDIHVWGYGPAGAWAGSNLPSKCFDSIVGVDRWIGIECDSPSGAVGFEAHGYQDKIDEMRCFANSWVADNALSCVQFDQANTYGSSVTNSLFEGVSGHRIAGDVIGAGINSVSMFGNANVGNVLTVNSLGIHTGAGQTISGASGSLTESNPVDVNFTHYLNCGLTATESCSVALQDRGSTFWYITKDAANNLRIYDVVGGDNRISLAPGGPTTFDVPNSNEYIFNVNGSQVASVGYDGTATVKQTVAAQPASVASANCLSAPAASTPCVAYWGSFTGLGSNGSSGTIALYSSNAPAGAVLQICPNIRISTAATAGTLPLSVNYTSPGGEAFGSYWIQNMSATAAGAAQNTTGAQCVTISLGTNSSASFVISAQSVTGSPVWETQPVVTRLH